MRVPGSAAAAMAALLAAAFPLASARADDAGHVPGSRHTGQDFSHLNAAHQTTPAPMARASAPAPMQAPSAPPPAMHATPAAAPGTSFGDVESLLRRAEAAMAAHRMQQASSELEQAETRLLNARDAGSGVAGQAIQQMTTARGDLSRGDAAAARQATQGVEQMLRQS